MSNERNVSNAGRNDTAVICPPRNWERDNICDVTILTYRLVLHVGDIPVECVSRYRIERCTEDYVLSDLLHSTTLFPGEEVFMSVRNRHTVSRFTEDASFSAAQVHRSSDRIWMETYQKMATDFDQTNNSSLKTNTHSSFSQSNNKSLNIEILGPKTFKTTVEGTFDEQSSQDFFSELHQHLESTFHQTNQVTRDSASVSLTEVNSHREVEAERNDELKVSTRRFKNINSCHTMTHYFYQIAKRQRVKIELIERTCRAVNELANTAVDLKPVSVSLATNQVVTAETAVSPAAGIAAEAVALSNSAANTFTQDQQILQTVRRIPLERLNESAKARDAAVAKADTLVANLPEFSTFEQVSIIPTEALYVESELGDCVLCEPFVIAKQELELERIKLENRKLRREIELLDQFKDYRCCDGEMAEDA